MKPPFTLATLVLLLAGGHNPCLAQTSPLRFEVATVKPVLPNARIATDFRIQGERLFISNAPLGLILQQAYEMKAYQIIGGAGWVNSDGFNIVAKAEGSTDHAQMLAMLRELLKEQFDLKLHEESREGQTFRLVPSKNGPNLRQSVADRTFVQLFRNTPSGQPGVSYTIVGQKASMPLLAQKLDEFEIRRPIVDETGVTGEFDFKLRYATDDNPETGPPLVIALQEQLGLKLVSARGAIRILVIDQATKPAI